MLKDDLLNYILHYWTRNIKTLQVIENQRRA